METLNKVNNPPAATDKVNNACLIEDNEGLVSFILANSNTCEKLREEFLKVYANSRLWNSDISLFTIENSLSVLQELKQKMVEKLEKIQNLQQQVGENAPPKSSLASDSKMLESVLEKHDDLISTYELVQFERELALHRSTSSQTILNEIRAFSDIFRAAFRSIKNILVILSTPELAAQIPFHTFQQLIGFYRHKGIKLTQQLYYKDTGSIGAELVRLIYREIIRRVENGPDDKSGGYILPLDKIFSKDSDTYIQLKFDYYHAIFGRLERLIVNKLEEKEQQQANIPWQVGWLGSSARINYHNKPYVVPRTVQTIYDKIQAYKDLILKTGMCTNPNSLSNNSALISTYVIPQETKKDLLEKTEKTLYEIYAMLEKKTSYHHNSILDSIVNFFKKIFGMGRSPEVVKLYDNFTRKY